MILFTILVIALLILLAIVIFALVTGGFALAVTFGDVIICILIIVAIFKLIFKKNKP